MIDMFRVDRSQKHDFIDYRTKMGQQFTHPGPTFTMFRELVRRPQQSEIRGQEGKLKTSDQRLWGPLAIVPAKFRIPLEQVLLRRTAVHVQIDHVLGGTGRRDGRRTRSLG